MDLYWITGFGTVGWGLFVLESYLSTRLEQTLKILKIHMAG